MDLKVTLCNVKKGKRVTLVKELPTESLFGNSYPIRKDTRGYITSDGFEGGTLRVEFYSHAYGTQKVKFNELSAENYLVTDIY